MTASIPSLDVLFRSPLVQRAYLRHIGLDPGQVDAVMQPADSEVPMDVRLRCVSGPDPDAVKREIGELALRLDSRTKHIENHGEYLIALATLAYELGARVR